MFGFNWIDGVISLLLILTVIEGIRIGFLTQVCAIAGFFSALFVAGWLFPHLIPVHDPILRAMLSGMLVLSTATYVGLRCLDLGQNIHWSFRLGRLATSPKLKWLETILGCAPGLLAGLLLVWLVGVAIGRLPFAGFSNSVRDSYMVQRLSTTLPPVPAVFAVLGQQVNGNAQPQVFAQPPTYNDFSYAPNEVQQAEATATASVVRITSFGCGGIVSGSGFVAAPNLIITNAHVIAGVERPIVKYQTKSYAATPVFFDAALDIAILRTERRLDAPALALTDTASLSDTTVAVLGYPGGNFQASPGIIREGFNVLSRSIYDVGVFGRDAYGVQTTVAEGSSGGPIVLADGRVAGVIFSRPTDSSQYAYAIAASYLKNSLHQAETSYRRVGTGACTAG